MPEKNILEERWAGGGGRCKWVSLTAPEIHSKIYQIIVRCGKSSLVDCGLRSVSQHRFLRLQKYSSVILRFYVRRTLPINVMAGICRETLP